MKRTALRHLVAEARYAFSMRALPTRVALFHWRARRLAWRTEDAFSLLSATRPADLALLLRLGRGRRQVAELGTATGWTAIALAIADPRREVVTYDPETRPAREGYLDLVGEDVRSRISFVPAPGSQGPPAGEAFDLLYIDSSHSREETSAEVNAWRSALRPGALIVLDDYAHEAFPGVREAVSDLGLSGQQLGTMFVHRVEAV